MDTTQVGLEEFISNVRSKPTLLRTIL